MAWSLHDPSDADKRSQVALASQTQTAQVVPSQQKRDPPPVRNSGAVGGKFDQTEQIATVDGGSEKQRHRPIGAPSGFYMPALGPGSRVHSWLDYAPHWIGTPTVGIPSFRPHESHWAPAHHHATQQAAQFAYTCADSNATGQASAPPQPVPSYASLWPANGFTLQDKGAEAQLRLALDELNRSQAHEAVKELRKFELLCRIRNLRWRHS